MTVELMTAGAVGKALRVDPRTVTRWAKEGRIGYVRTRGGHRRYFAEEVEGFRRGEPLSQAQVRALRLQAEGGERS